MKPEKQIVLLLTAHLPGREGHEARPLTPTEWGRFAAWLHGQGANPCDLLEDGSEILRDWDDKTVTVSRIEELLRRGHALAFSMERWERSGIWVMTRSDPDYPDRLKKRLGRRSPALFFGCGDRSLIGTRAIAVVGSRKASGEDLRFARDFGGQAAAEGFTIVSGGARGTDEAAILGALEAGGKALGVLANGLLKTSTSRKYRDYATAGNLTLISPFNPEAGFSVGNAMARNSYIYCLVSAAVIAHWTTGGTFSGAVENLKHGWTPLWVKETADGEAGNAAIVSRGGGWLAPGTPNLEGLLLPAGGSG